MAARKRGRWWYGDGPEDLRAELERYGQENGYVPTWFAEPRCSCGSDWFTLLFDDEQGAAVRCCTSCGTEHAIADSADVLDDAELDQATCLCGGQTMELCVGIAFYDSADAARWIYIGGFCTECKLIACYTDWKLSVDDGDDLLQRL